MTLYSPEPKFDKAEKRLLVLLEKLLLEPAGANRPGSNIPIGVIALSDKEAAELFERLEQLVNSRKFVEACEFVEGLTRREPREEARMREIFLSGRTRRGRTRVLSSKQWSDFTIRFGFGNNAPWGTSSTRMDFGYFLRMERKLLIASGLQPRVVDLVLSAVQSQARQIDEIRRGLRSLERGVIRRSVINPFSGWRTQFEKIQNWEISTHRVAAVIAIVADTSILFTTRDWSVAGTISTMAGALVAASAN